MQSLHCCYLVQTCAASLSAKSPRINTYILSISSNSRTSVHILSVTSEFSYKHLHPLHWLTSFTVATLAWMKWISGSKLTHTFSSSTGTKFSHKHTFSLSLQKNTHSLYHFRKRQIKCVNKPRNNLYTRKKQRQKCLLLRQRWQSLHKVQQHLFDLGENFTTDWVELEQ